MLYAVLFCAWFKLELDTWAQPKPRYQKKVGLIHGRFASFVCTPSK